MRNGITLLVFLLLGIAATSQDKVFQRVEIESGTDRKQWNTHLLKHVALPDSISKLIPVGTYKVVLSFIIDVHGNLSQVKVVDDPGHELGRRAVSILQSYKGKWTPANQCGRMVKSYKKETIIFSISD